MINYKPEEYRLPAASGLTYSLIAHTILFLCFIFDLPSIKNDVPQEKAITIDLVTISEVTNIKTAVKAKEQKIPEKKPNDPPTTKDLSQPKASNLPTSLPIIPVTKTQAESKKIEAQKTSKPKLEEVHEKKITTTIPKKQETRPEKKKNRKIEGKQFPIEKNINKKISHKVTLKSLKANDKKISPEDKKILNKKFKELEDLIEAEFIGTFNSDLQLSATEIDSIRNQIIRCWNQIAFLGRDDNMSVTLLLNIDKSGNVISIKPVLENNQNPLYGVFVNSAIRAVKMASPLQNLPPSKFQSWKEIEMPFNPRDLK